MSKLEQIEPHTNHHFAFATLPTTVSAHEVQTLAANLIAANLWFEFSPTADDYYSIRVRSEAYPFLAELREQFQ